MPDEHPSAALAEALDVSSSGCFAHRQKDTGVRRQEDQALAREIVPIFGGEPPNLRLPARHGSPVPEQAAGRQKRAARRMRKPGLVPRQ